MVPASTYLSQVYDDYPKLNKVLAAFFEGLRLFRTYHLIFTIAHRFTVLTMLTSIASGYLMIREAFEDTMLQVPNPHGEEGVKTLHVPKGTEVFILQSVFFCVQLYVDY